MIIIFAVLAITWAVIFTLIGWSMAYNQNPFGMLLAFLGSAFFGLMIAFILYEITKKPLTATDDQSKNTVLKNFLEDQFLKFANHNITNAEFKASSRNFYVTNFNEINDWFQLQNKNKNIIEDEGEDWNCITGFILQHSFLGWIENNVRLFPKYAFDKNIENKHKAEIAYAYFAKTKEISVEEIVFWNECVARINDV